MDLRISAIVTANMTEPEAKEKALLSDKLGALTDVELREYGLEAIRQMCVHSTPAQLTVRLKQWTRKLFPLVCPGLKEESMVPHEITCNTLDKVSLAIAQGDVRPYHMRMAQFWQWMELAGFAIPFDAETNGRIESKSYWAITPIGRKRLDTDHPCRPGAMKRLHERFGSELPDSLARLEDAHVCFEHGLYRPTLMLLGIAWEDMLAKVAERCGVDAKKAAGRIEGLRTHFEGGKRTDAKAGALLALAVANSIREKRNDVSHEADSKIDPIQVDELLTAGTQFYDRLAGYVPS